MSDITQIGSNITGGINSVSINGTGNIVAIGSEYQNTYKGLTKIYKWNGTSWVQLGGDIIGEAASDYSGRSVSLNNAGNIVAIGATYNDGGGNGSGSTRIYQYDASKTVADANGPIGWNQLGGDIDGEAEGDQSGKSVSLNDAGDIVAIGAHRNDPIGGNEGHTRIFQYDASKTVADANGPIGWNQLGQDIDGEAFNDQSGTSVSLNSQGNIVAIGAPYNDGNSGSSIDSRGHTRIFQYNSSSNAWAQLGGDIDGEAASDFSGYSVSLNSAGDRVAIGAPNNSNWKGHTRIYEYNSSSNDWVQLGGDIDGQAYDDYSGTSVSLNSAGDIVAIGDEGFYDGSGNRNGQVRIFQYDGTNWVQFGSDIDGQASGNKFGYSVSLNNQGDIVAIGANAGRYTQVYELDIDLNLDNLVNSDVSMISPVVDATSRVTVNKVVTGNNSIASFTAANVTVPVDNPSIMILSLDAFDLADNQLNLTGLTGNERIWIEVEYPNYNPSNNYDFLKYDEVTLKQVTSPDYPVKLKPVFGKPNTLGGYLTGLSVIGLNEKSNTTKIIIKKKVVPKKKYIYLFNNTTGCKRRVLC